jgi:phosphoribosylformylglycinamidine cyclo-ligase
LKLAFATGVHNTIGIDCVAMCVNDIITVGAKPLFFLDYFATGRLDPEVGAAVVEGIAEGCRQASCALLGGETAEMPGMYPDGEYDLAGFVVGALHPGAERLPEHAKSGDILIGVRASGLHSNGFSLARRVLLDDEGLSFDSALPGDSLALGERLLTPTRIYVRALASLADKGVRVTSCSHITGGGLWENPQRAFGEGLAARFDLPALQAMRHDIFTHISRIGGVPEREMYRVFNMGLGLVLSVSPADVEAALSTLRAADEEASVVGVLEPRGDAPVVIEGVSSSALK